MTINGVIVPEYTIDNEGRYATDEDTAWQLFEMRNPFIDEQVRKRYSIPNDMLYQIQHIPLSIGLILLSPIVIPIIYFSDLLSDSDDKIEKKSFKQTIKHYFAIAVNEPINYDVTLQNEFEIVNIQP